MSRGVVITMAHGHVLDVINATDDRELYTRFTVYTMCLQIMVVTVGICRPYNKKQHLHNLHGTNVDIVHSQDVAMNDI